MSDYSKVLTFDGTSGSGKGTIAREVAHHYNYAYLDTGKLYRALALLIVRQKLEDSFLDKLNDLKDQITSQTLADHHLYDEDITLLASRIAREEKVREVLFKFQKDFINNHDGVVLDGRDTGSIICPEAKFKFYVDGDLKVRAKRRYLQNQELYDSLKMSEEDVAKTLEERDNRDKNRKIAPLIIPDGADIIDNSRDPLDVIVKKVIDKIDSSY